MTGTFKTKRDNSIGHDENTLLLSSSGSLVRTEAVDSAIENIKQLLCQKLQPLKDDAEYSVNKCQQIYATNMIKIPRNVKSMKIEEFDAVYHSDLLSLVKYIGEEYSYKNPALENCRFNVSETPGMAIRSNRSLYTQTVRKGREPTKGDFVATVARKRPGQRPGLQQLAEMGISVGDGSIVPLTDEDCIKELDTETRSFALDQALILQEQIAKVVDLLKK